MRFDITAFKNLNDTGYISVSKSKVDYASNGMTNSSYRKKHTLSGNFEVTGSLSSTPFTPTTPILYTAFMIGESEFIDYQDQIANYPNDAMLQMFMRLDASDNLIIRFLWSDGGVTDQSDLIISSATLYFWRIRRVGTSVTLELFTDEAMATQHGTTQTLTGTTTQFNWLYSYATYYLADISRSYTGYTSNIEVAQNDAIGVKTPAQTTTETTKSISGITTPSSTVDYVNSLGGSGSTTSDTDGVYTITPTLTIGINAITISVSGQSDEIINIERVASYPQAITTASIETGTTLDIEGPYHMANQYDGLYHQAFYALATSGNMHSKLGKDVGAGLAFKDRQDSGLSAGVNPTKMFTFQDTYYSSWHDAMFMSPNGYSFRPVADDDTTYQFLTSGRGALISSTPSVRSNVSGAYAEDGYVNALIYEETFTRLQINRTSDASSGTSLSVVIPIKTYADTSIEIRHNLIEFENSDLGAVYAYDGALSYTHWNQTAIETEIQITPDLFSINTFKAFRDNEDNVFFVYKKMDGSIAFKKLTDFTTLSSEIPIVPYADSFQATLDMSKASAFYIFYSLADKIYMLPVIDSVAGDYSREVVTDLAEETYLSAPYFEADEIGVQYKNSSGHRLLFVLPTNKQVRSTTGNFIGYCRPDNGFAHLVSLKSTGFEKSLIFFQDRSGYGKTSIFNHDTDVLDEDAVVITPRYHDLHNQPDLSLLSDNSVWFFHGGSTHELESYPIVMESFDDVFDSVSFDLNATTNEAIPTIPASTSYKRFLPIGSELYFWGASYATVLQLTRYTGATWDAMTPILAYSSGDPIPETAPFLKYIHGVNVDTNGDIHLGYTHRTNTTPVTELGSVVALETRYAKIEVTGSSYALISSANEVMAMPVYSDPVEGDAIISSNAEILTYGGSYLAGGLPRVANTPYILDDKCTYNGYTLTCTVAGTTSADVSPTFTYIQHSEFTDGSVTWRVDGLDTDYFQSIGSFDNKVSSTFGAAGNICFARLALNTANPSIVEEVFFISQDVTGAWEYVTINSKSASIAISSSHPQLYSVGDSLVVFYSLSTDGGPEQLVYQSSDDGGITWMAHNIFKPSTFNQVNLSSTAVVGNPGLISLLWEEKVSTAYTELRNDIVPFAFGSVQITIEDDNGDPVIGGTWAIDGVGAYTSEQTVSNVFIGDRLISFSTVPGYTTPGSRNVSVTEGGTATDTGVYIIDVEPITLTIQDTAQITIVSTLSLIPEIEVDLEVQNTSQVTTISTINLAGAEGKVFIHIELSKPVITVEIR